VGVKIFFSSTPQQILGGGEFRENPSARFRDIEVQSENFQRSVPQKRGAAAPKFSRFPLRTTARTSGQSFVETANRDPDFSRASHRRPFSVSMSGYTDSESITLKLLPHSAYTESGVRRGDGPSRRL